MTNQQYYCVLRGRDIRRIIKEKQRNSLRRFVQQGNHEFVRVMSQPRRRSRSRSRHPN